MGTAGLDHTLGGWGGEQCKGLGIYGAAWSPNVLRGGQNCRLHFEFRSNMYYYVNVTELKLQEYVNKGPSESCYHFGSGFTS